MKHILGVIFLLSCFALSAFAAEGNPLKKAKVGDWVKYDVRHTVTGAMTIDMKGTTTYTVIEKDDEEITIEVTQEGQVGGRTMKETDTRTIDITDDSDDFFDPTGMINGLKGLLEYPPLKDKIKVVKRENEKVEASGKTFNCNYTEYSMDTEDGKTIGHLY